MGIFGSIGKGLKRLTGRGRVEVKNEPMEEVEKLLLNEKGQNIKKLDIIDKLIYKGKYFDAISLMIGAMSHELGKRRPQPDQLTLIFRLENVPIEMDDLNLSGLPEKGELNIKYVYKKPKKYQKKSAVVLRVNYEMDHKDTDPRIGSKVFKIKYRKPVKKILREKDVQSRNMIYHIIQGLKNNLGRIKRKNKPILMK